MINGYARTYVDFWTGPTGIKLAQAGDEGVRSLAHFLYSGPNCAAWGLYYKPVDALVHEFRRPAPGTYVRAEKEVRDWLAVLEELDYADVDDETGFIWVKEMAAHQFRPLPWKSSNLLVKSARRWYASVSRNRFLGPFFDRYDMDLQLSSPFAFPGSEVLRREWAGTPKQVALMEVTLAPTDVKTLTTRPTLAGETEFAAWWDHYPEKRRKARKPCLQSWLRKRIPRDRVAAMIDMLELQKRSSDWTKNGGQYVPLPLTYINQERYDDEHGTLQEGGQLNSTNEVTAATMQRLIGEFEK